MYGEAVSDNKLDEIKLIIDSSEDLTPRISSAEMTPETKFSLDMGFDSMAMMSLIYELQEKYPNLDETEAIQSSSVSQLMAMLK